MKTVKELFALVQFIFLRKTKHFEVIGYVAKNTMLISIGNYWYESSE